MFEKEPPAAEDPAAAQENLIATPHIGGSTEEAQEIVGVRIVEQIVEYLQHGVALNAVNHARRYAGSVSRHRLHT